MTNQKMGFLSSITSDIQTALNSKWNTPSNSSSLSFVDISSSLTNLLMNKWNAPYNELNLMNVDITSSLTGLLNGKWNTPSNASSLSNVDISSSLTTLLSNKWNTPSNASSLSNVDISSSLTTLLSNKWNTPSNASSLSNVDISSSLTNLLNSKYNIPFNQLNLVNVDITSSLTGLLGSKANLNGNTYTGTHDFAGATVSGITANLDSPTLTGTPLAPTASSGTNTTQLATTAFVNNAIISGSPGLLFNIFQIPSDIAEPATGYTFLNSDLGTLIRFSLSGSGRTFNLPTPSATNNGKCIGFILVSNSSSSNRAVTIDGQAINVPATVTLTFGVKLYCISNGSSWRKVG